MPDYMTIPLGSRGVCKVSPQDHARLSRFTWHRDGRYAVRRDESAGVKRKIYMHREVLQGAAEVDHINGDGLDNQRRNLRSVTHRQNTYNSRGVPSASSRYKGVTWSNLNRGWLAYINTYGRRVYIGTFQIEEEAARARDAVALHIQGEHAWTNFPGGEPMTVEEAYLTFKTVGRKRQRKYPSLP